MENELTSTPPLDVESGRQESSTDYRVSEYRSFPAFEQWAKCTLDEVRWTRYKGQLEKHKQAPPSQFQKAQAIVKRVAAIETGVIEDLYQGDSNFTLTAASGIAVWEAALGARDKRIQTLIASQLEAYDYVMDLASGDRPIAEAWIRELHTIICKGQETYTALTPAGFQEQALLRGAYKTQPNHIKRPDKILVSGASVEDTPAEMSRLCDELRSNSFLNAHPVLQSSYAHYAFVSVHPFPDGNGRVARALASVFTHRAISIPLLIVGDNGREYRNALALADQGDYQLFVDFILERTFDAIRLIDESLRAAELPSLRDSFNDIQRLYTTTGGYTHEEVDIAGHEFFRLFHSELNRQLQEGAESSDKFKFSFSRSELNSNPRHQFAARKPRRWPILQGQPVLVVKLETGVPASAAVSFKFVVEVPQDSKLEDDLIIYELEKPTISIEARISELHPRPGIATEMRMRMSVERVASQMLQILKDEARSSLRKKGY